MTESKDAGAIPVKTMAYHEPADLARVRQLVVQQANAAGVTADRASALSVAVNELAVHSLRQRDGYGHGGGGVVSMWATGDEVRVTVAIEGTFNPVSVTRPVDDPAAEHGLLLIGALCDQVHIRKHVGGVTVHIAMDRR